MSATLEPLPPGQPLPLAEVCSQELLAVAVQAPLAATRSELVPLAGASSRA